MSGPSQRADADPKPERGLAGLAADVLAGVARLVQGELALARAEAAERMRRLQRSALSGAVALVLGVTAVNALAAAGVAGAVALGLSPVGALALGGGGLLLLAFGFAAHATRLLRAAGSLPGQSGASVKRDLETLQSLLQPDGVRRDGAA